MNIIDKITSYLEYLKIRCGYTVSVHIRQNIFESILFTKTVQPQNHIRQVNEPIASYYFHLAIILFDEKDYEECLKMLEYVLSYNPVYIEALLLKSECYLQTGYNNFFFDNIKEALLYSYTRVQHHLLIFSSKKLQIFLVNL